MHTDVCQRWYRGRGSYVSTRAFFKPDRFSVQVLDDDTTPRTFIEQHHYSGSYCAAVFRVGLFEKRRNHQEQLVGACVFAEPAQSKVVSCWSGGLPKSQGTTLARLVLLERVLANAESWFVKRALDQLKEARPGLKVVVSYSDPVERTTVWGETVMPGHVGAVYQALGARFVGRAEGRTNYLTTRGTILDGRTLTKVRKGEKGAAPFYERLLAAGAPPRAFGEDPRAYVRRVLREGPFRPQRHPGNLVYLFALGDPEEKRETLAQAPKALVYLKARTARVLDPTQAGRRQLRLILEEPLCQSTPHPSVQTMPPA